MAREKEPRAGAAGSGARPGPESTTELTTGKTTDMVWEESNGVGSLFSAAGLPPSYHNATEEDAASTLLSSGAMGGDGDDGVLLRRRKVASSNWHPSHAALKASVSSHDITLPETLSHPYDGDEVKEETSATLPSEEAGPASTHQPHRNGSTTPSVPSTTPHSSSSPSLPSPPSTPDHGHHHSSLSRAHHNTTTAAAKHRHHNSTTTTDKRFVDLVFTHTFSAFDRRRPNTAPSPSFHGFFTLFWMGVFLFAVKIAADNWRRTGSPLGTNEIMRIMFQREVLVLLVADGVMCGVTGVGWVVQRGVVRRGWFGGWEKGGWVVQHIWQTLFIGGVVGLTLLRDWPWTHTVFFVLHGLVMLMKQHSYAFYNGHLSTVYKRRTHLLAKLTQLERMSPTPSPLPSPRTEPHASDISTAHLARVPSAREHEDEEEKRRRRSLAAEDGDKTAQQPPDVERIIAAIDSNGPLSAAQVAVFARVLRWEADALADELRGRSTTTAGREYPHNLTLRNHYEFIVLPTVVYELEYPRSEGINWGYAAEKAAACAGVILVMIMVSQAFIYPVVMDTVRMKEEGVPLAGRFRQFPWMLLDLVFPFMMEYLLAWYLIWETILNLLAELTYFADRGFYDAWWNCVSWDQFARDWNRPVHNFLLRHVYHSSISAMKVDRHTATLITFFLSACVHELVMWCIFKKLRGYLLFLQMCQLPLVRLSRTKWLRNRPTLGNVIFWLGIFTGPSVLCSLYLIL